MIQVQIEDGLRNLQKLEEQLSEKQLIVAKTRAINRAIQKANTLYRKQIVEQYNLKYADTNNILFASRATYTSPIGKVAASTKPISISRFNPRFIKNKKAFSIKNIKNTKSGKRELTQMSRSANKSDTSGGVSFEIKKGELKRLPFAFMIQSGKPGLSMQVWARGEYSGNNFVVGKSRKSITPLKTVSPFGAMTNLVIQNQIKDNVGDNMRNEFERQVQLQLKKITS